MKVDKWDYCHTAHTVFFFYFIIFLKLNMKPLSEVAPGFGHSDPNPSSVNKNYSLELKFYTLAVIWAGSLEKS